MGMKTFDDVGNVGFSKSWRDEVQDLMLEFRAGDVRAVRFVGGFLPVVTHWMPFISKNGGRIRFFPQMCLRWNLEASAIDEDAECPGCDRDVFAAEGGVFWLLDVDALYVGDKSRALKLMELGSRERQKLGNLSKFNKVQGTPQNVAHSKYGRIVQVSYDPNNADKSMRWQFSNHDRLQVKLLNEGTKLKVKIPESADSDYVGKVFEFELQDLLEIVFPPSLSEVKDKCRRMKVDEALKRLKADDKKEEDDDEGGHRRRRRGSSPRRGRDEDADDRRSRRRRSRDEDDDLQDDDGDDDEGKKPRSRRGSRGRDEDADDRRSRRRRGRDEDDDSSDDDDPQDDFGDDDDFDDDDGQKDKDEEKPRRGRKKKEKAKRGQRTRAAQRDDDEDDDDEDEKAACNKKASRGNKCALHKGCLGLIGNDDTEDCTICVHRDDCMDLNAADED